MSTKPTINLNCLLPKGITFEPAFGSEEGYQRFRERYQKSIDKELEKQQQARRKSEEKARKRMLD